MNCSVRTGSGRCHAFVAAAIACFLGFTATLPAATTAPAPMHPLDWDTMDKAYQAKPGDSVAEVAFEARNTSAKEVVVERVEPSCGCTIAELPSHPWRLAPGAAGTLKLKIDLIGKSGELQKSAVIYSTAGVQTLNVTLSVPPMSDAARQANQAAAGRNRQAVFQGDCARCHAVPTVDKEGGALFVAACAICHASPHRATMVPNLTHPTTSRDAVFWHGIIAEGREGTLMPAFSKARGGPLTDVQIASLVDFLMQNFPRGPQQVTQRD